MTTPTLWLVHDSDETAHFVIARDQDEAIRLYVATTGTEAPQLRAEVPSWRLATRAPAFPARVIGVWAPDDATLAGYGCFPDEDWRECQCCGLVLPEEDYDEDDSDVCHECAAPDPAPKEP